MEFESYRALGDVWALTELWRELGFEKMRRLFRLSRGAIDVEACARIMVFHWLCDPACNMSVYGWVKTVGMPRLWLKVLEPLQLRLSLRVLHDHEAEIQEMLHLDAPEAGAALPYPAAPEDMAAGADPAPPPAELHRANALMAAMRTQLQSVMQSRLAAAGSALTPAEALAQLRQVRLVRVDMGAGQPIAGPSIIGEEQQRIFQALQVRRPKLQEPRIALL